MGNVRVRTLSTYPSFVRWFLEDGRFDRQVNQGGHFGARNFDRRDLVEDLSECSNIRRESRERMRRVRRGERSR